MNAELREAVDILDATSKRFTGPHFMVMKLTESKEAWQTIRQALRDQEAEIATLKACLANAEKAVADYRESIVSIFRLVRERDDRELQKHMEADPITAHLGGENNG